MPLPSHIARPLYRALLSTAKQYQHELSSSRGAILRPKELDRLRTTAASPLPKELRGLLDIRTATTSQKLDLITYIRTCAKRLSQAATTPQLQFIDSDVGFVALKHMNSRVDALRHLVYSTSSDAQKHGIRIEVESSYQGADRERYFFRYQVRICNDSTDTVQLLSRAWTIRDLDGRVLSVEGPGVVGAFPTLAPSETYEYSSGVPLHTPLGTQSGHYVFILQDGDSLKQKDLSKKMLHVPIAPFSYRSPSMDGKKGDNGVLSPSVTTTSTRSNRRRRRNDDMRRR